MRYLLISIFLFVASHPLFAQDKGKIIIYKNEFYDSIKVVSPVEGDKPREKKKILRADFAERNIPQSVDEFESVWHTPPISQGRTNTCWAFATSSFLESEIKRENGLEIKLSEAFTVYHEYLEKACRYIDKRGDSRFAEGSLSPVVLEVWEKYGAVPEEVYPGKPDSVLFHNHNILFDELKELMRNVKEENLWNKNAVLNNMKVILDRRLGKPPENFTWNGKTYTPLEFARKALKFDKNDYISITSMLNEDYGKFIQLQVPDNWWKGKNYYNVSLDNFIKILRSSVKGGYSLCLDGDVGESGIDGYMDAAIIPTYDIPSEYIDAKARYFRFNNESTSDDHLIHCLGITKNSDGYWYLIKDSGSNGFNGKHKGYYFYHEDYIKLKMLFFLVNKNAVKDILPEID